MPMSSIWPVDISLWAIQELSGPHHPRRPPSVAWLVAGWLVYFLPDLVSVELWKCPSLCPKSEDQAKVKELNLKRISVTASQEVGDPDPGRTNAVDLLQNSFAHGPWQWLHRQLKNSTLYFFQTEKLNNPKL